MNPFKINKRIMALGKELSFPKETDKTISSLEALISKQFNNLNEVNVSTIFNILGKGAKQNPEIKRKYMSRVYELVDSLESKIEELRGERKFTPRCISNSFNGIARLDYKGGVCRILTEILLGEKYDTEKKFNPQELANLANAYAKLGIKDERVFGFISEQTVKRKYDTEKKFNPQDLANLANAYAKLGIRDEGVFGFINEQIVGRKYNTRERFTPQGLANLAYGYGLLGIEIPQPILQEINDCSGFEDIDITQLVMAFSLLGKECPNHIGERYTQIKP